MKMRTFPVKTVPMKQQTQRGFTLIEVMIVFFVLSVGLLGMAALQMKSMQYNQAAYIRSQATVAAYDMLDRMRVNTGGNYAHTVGTAVPSGSTIADKDLIAWLNFLAASLPRGDGGITCLASQCTVTVQWFDREANQTVESPVSITTQL